MIRRLNHIAVVVPDLDAAAALYRDALAATVSKPCDYPEHGVRVIFIELENAKIELLYPLDAKSPIASFLQRHPKGGMHHICVEVDNVKDAGERLKKNGVRLLNDGVIRKGAHDKPVLFLHPGDLAGTLLELEQAG